MKKLLLIASSMVLVGCHLDDLLNPGPPPEEEKCYQTITWTVIQQQDADTTYYHTRREVPCP